MDLFQSLPKLMEAPIIALLAAVVLALAWTLIRMLALMPQLPGAIIEAVSQAGQKSALALKQTIDELQETIHELQTALREERERLDRANDEIDELKNRLAAVDRDRRQAIEERDIWQRKAGALEEQVRALEQQVGRLSKQVQELDRRLAA